MKWAAKMDRLTERLIQEFKLVAVQRGLTNGSDTMISVHAAGCSDIAREKRDKAGEVMEIPGDMSPDEAVRWVIQDLEDGGHEKGSWQPRDITVYPCCRTGSATAKPLDPKYCPGSGKDFASEVDYSYAYPRGICPVCGHSLGARGSVVPKHGKTAEFKLPNGTIVRVKPETTHVVYWEEGSRDKHPMWKEFSDQGSAERSLKGKVRDSYCQNAQIVRVEAEGEE
jgi:hypothetical protein